MSKFRRALMLGLMVLGWAEEARRDGKIDPGEAADLLRLVADHLELSIQPMDEAPMRFPDTRGVV